MYHKHDTMREAKGTVLSENAMPTRDVVEVYPYSDVFGMSSIKNMISYEKELDIDNKLHNYLKITGILNNVFRRQKTP